MDIVLLSEVIKEQDLWAYPYNALRNQALARADTDVRVSPLTRAWTSAGYPSNHTLQASMKFLRLKINSSLRSFTQCTHMQVLLLLDADFIASAGLHEFLTQSGKAADLLEDLVDNRKVIVLPAFETEASLGMEAGGEMALKAHASESLLLPALL